MEVKNWSGTIGVDPDTGHWIQERTSGHVVDHGDIVEVLQRKAAGVNRPCMRTLSAQRAWCACAHTGLCNLPP
jgi:hypothetical protein